MLIFVPPIDARPSPLLASDRPHHTDSCKIVMGTVAPITAYENHKITLPFSRSAPLKIVQSRRGAGALFLSAGPRVTDI